MRFIVLIFALQLSAFAQGESIPKEKVYTFSKPNVPLVSIMAEAYYKLINAELAKENIRIKLIEVPLLRSLLEVDKGLIDGDMARTEIAVNLKEYQNIFQLDATLASIKIKAIVPFDSKVNNVDDLPKKAIVGNLQGDVLSTQVAQKFQSVDASNYEQLLELLHRKRIDYFLTVAINDIPILKSSKFKYKVLQGELYSTVIKPVLHKKFKNTTLETSLIRIINTLRETGKFEELNDHFLKQ